MDIIYGGWEQWLLNVSNRKSTSFIPVHESSIKTLHSIMGTWTWTGEKEDGSNEGRLRDDSDSEEVSDDDKGYFSDSETNIIRRWASPPHVTSHRQSSPEKSVESVMTGVDDMNTGGTKMEGSPNHNLSWECRILKCRREPLFADTADMSARCRRHVGEVSPTCRRSCRRHKRMSCRPEG